MRSTAPIRTCAPSWRAAGSATCWPSPATGGCPPPPGRSAPTPWPPPCRGGAGRGRRAGPAAAAGLAATVGRPRRKGAALLRLGLPRPARTRPLARRRLLVAAHPPLPAHRRAGLLPLLSPHPGAADRTGRGRRTALDRRRMLPAWQGSGRSRRAPAAPLAALAPLDPVGDARPRPAGRPRRRRTRRRAAPGADSAHLQRAPAAAHPSGPRPSTPPCRPGDLVPVAPTAPIPRPRQPLPPPSGRTPMIKIYGSKIYGWGVRPLLRRG